MAAYAAVRPITSYNDICNRSQHFNFGEAQAESPLMMVYVNRNMLEQFFYIHGPVYRESNLITVQQDAPYSVYYISVGSSTCFGC